MATIRRKIKKHKFSGKLGIFHQDPQKSSGFSSIPSFIFFEEIVYPGRETEQERWGRETEARGRLIGPGNVFMIIGDQYKKDAKHRSRAHRSNCKCRTCYRKGGVAWCTILTADGQIAAILAKNIRLYAKP